MQDSRTSCASGHEVGNPRLHHRVQKHAGLPVPLGRGSRRGHQRPREEVVVTRAGHEPVVIVSLADYESLRETAYLMRSPANARRLLDAMERLEAGGG
ncbi:YefM protein (antitoxin to YoeB) [Serinicoccus hydrothermalis]|uniref:Antitoxin n=1 Tax=Serinicoccus hydrothermalis TaxID=1758689 RepID=A0A1B1NFE6_9MICO|nr:YefM protein (antitoxin to YoeB) [Serinicoccus hydrothermalis]